jgi:sterol desaturase/sphingolipid hydroxylase (fatty acid hydroxylase superfamily)
LPPAATFNQRQNLPYFVNATHWIIANEPWVRGTAFLAILLVMALWEQRAPRRRRVVDRRARWFGNLAIVALNTALVRLLLPLTAVGLALVAAERGWGVLNHWQLPAGLAVAFGVVALDLLIYLQHVLFHAVPALWRLHRAHHADIDIDVTTGVRFHPIEILLSMLIKFASIVALGIPALAVLLFEVLLNATSLFSHSNVRLPPALDRALRWLVVTPDMHRVHHSIAPRETNSNFGFNLSWWDRLFRTYRDQPEAGHEAMVIGLEDWREPRRVTPLPAILALPFRGPPGRYPWAWRTRGPGNAG